MKKLFAILPLLLAGTTFTNAQYSAVDYTSDDYVQFKASKTYVVKTGDAMFDSQLESAIKDNWKATSYEVIDEKTFKTKLPDKTASFILPVTIETGKPNQNYHYLAVLNGGRKNLDRYGYNDMLAYGIINYWGNENPLTNCAYRVRNMVESMVQAMDMIQKNGIKGNSKNMVDDLRDLYNKKSGKIKDRTLLIPDYMINKKLTKEDIKAAYPFKHEICPKSKIEQAIKDKSTEYYYFQPAITLNKSMFVFDPSNGEVLYSDYAMMGLFIKQSDIEDLTKTIKGEKK